MYNAPTIFEDSDTGKWWWYIGTATPTDACPTHGPFDIEAMARKHCSYYLQQLKSMGCVRR